MVAVATAWVLGLCIGWTRVFLSDPASVTWSSDGRVSELWATFRHAGRQVSTLGSGATDPEGVVWCVAGVVGAISGMIVTTLGVSFILTTTATVTSGRALCGLAEAPDSVDPGAVATTLPVLAEVVAGLNSAPSRSTTRPRRRPAACRTASPYWPGARPRTRGRCAPTVPCSTTRRASTCPRA